MESETSINDVINDIISLRKESKINLFYIDLFCGAGGTSTGVESATIDGERVAKVIACVNHDKNAIASHMANHPNALHFIEDIRTVELSPIIELMDRIKAIIPNAIFVLWASLECVNFSKAKGGLPRDADSRTLAEHLFRYIDVLNPDRIQIENVEEFMSWGALDENGKPVSKDKGNSYLRWIENVKKYDYYFDFRILNSADFGAYTSRKRFFGQFAKKGMSIDWPTPTHKKQVGAGEVLQLWKPVKDVLDLEDEGKSIFTRKKPLSEKTLERIYAGLIKFVAGGKDKWLLKYNSVNGNTGKHNPPSVDEPCPTVACQSRLGLVQAHFLSKYFSGHPESKNIPVTGPAHTIKCKDNHSLISAKFLSAYYGNGYNHSVNKPSPTVTTKDRLSYISPKSLDMQYRNGTPSSVEAPAGTVTVNPKHHPVSCRPWIMNTNFSNIGSQVDEPAPTITANRKWHYIMNPQFASPGGSVNDPCFTLIARMDKRPPHLVSLNTVFNPEEVPDFVKVDSYGNIYIEVYKGDSEIMFKIKEFMAIYGLYDIFMRMLKIEELLSIMGFPEDYKLIGTKADQKKFIGNAVEVNMARVLCEAIAEISY